MSFGRQLLRAGFKQLPFDDSLTFTSATRTGLAKRHRTYIRDGELVAVESGKKLFDSGLSVVSDVAGDDEDYILRFFGVLHTAYDSRRGKNLIKTITKIADKNKFTLYSKLVIIDSSGGQHYVAPLLTSFDFVYNNPSGLYLIRRPS